jgi:hypothetical protein
MEVNHYDAQRLATINYLTNRIKLIDLIYIPVGYYNEVYARPYITAVNHMAISELAGRMRENNTKLVTENELRGLTSDIIKPSAVPGFCAIDRGWLSTPRYIFVLSVQATDIHGLAMNYYIQGYTNYNGISMHGHADPNMEHYINNIIETTVITTNTPFGINTTERIHKVYNVISNTNSTNDNYIFLQRPYDVYSNIETMITKDLVFQGSDYYSVLDTRYMINSLNSIAKPSTVTNNIPIEYVRNVINAGIKGATQQSFQLSINDYNEAYYSKENIAEVDMISNIFIQYLRYKAGRTHLYSFEFRDLLNLDVTIADRFKLINITKADDLLAQTPEVGEYWTGQNLETIIAYSIIETAVATALQYGFIKIHCTISNMYDQLGTIHSIVTYFQSYIQLPEDQLYMLADMFKNSIINKAFLDLTYNNKLPCTVNIYVDVFGTTKISLMINGSNETWYTIPAFANSLFAPIVTMDKNGLDNLSRDVQLIVDELVNI